MDPSLFLVIRRPSFLAKFTPRCQDDPVPGSDVSTNHSRLITFVKPEFWFHQNIVYSPFFMSTFPFTSTVVPTATTSVCCFPFNPALPRPMLTQPITFSASLEKAGGFGCTREAFGLNPNVKWSKQYMVRSPKDSRNREYSSASGPPSMATTQPFRKSALPSPGAH